MDISIPSIGIDHSRRVAVRWNVGSGRELRSYPVGMFRDIFGVEDGWLVYMGVRTIQYREEKAKEPNQWAFGTHRSAATLPLAIYFVNDTSFTATLALVPIAILCGSVAILQADDVAALLIPLAFFGLMTGGLGTPAILISAFCSSDPEEKAESELKRQWYKAPSAK